MNYQGQEDDIIQSIEAGNVSMNLNNSLISGSSALFGIKTDLKFGKLKVQALVSQQNSESQTVSSKGGAQTTNFEVPIDSYDENRHFFLGYHFRENYEQAMSQLPYIASSITINRIEVWVTNKRGNYDQSRNIVALADLGEYDPAHILNQEWVISTGAKSPHNKANKLYETLTGSLEGEEENVNPELEYLTLIRKIRDEDIELFEKIKKLPLKCKSGKKAKLVSGNGTISFIRKGALKAFFKTVGEETQELTFIETMQYVKCDENEPKIPIKEIYFDQLATNKSAFNNKLIQETLETTEGKTVSGNDKKILTYLKALLSCRKFTETEENTIEKIKTMLEYGELPQALTKQIVADIKNVEDPIQIYHLIVDSIPMKYFDGRKTKKIERKGKKQVILSCYLEG
jgi:hypothetical protein